MAQQKPPAAEPDEFPSGDPWLAFGYLVSGVLLYGLIGWLLDRWLGTSFLVVVGILLGITLGMLMTWWRFRAPVANPPQIHETRGDPDQNGTNQHHQT
jgi:F0F1-type ATP synthase assembly protein I